jgi:hypothetical protein
MNGEEEKKLRLPPPASELTWWKILLFRFRLFSIGRTVKE